MEPVIAAAQPPSVETSPAPEPFFAGAAPASTGDEAMAALADLVPGSETEAQPAPAEAPAAVAPPAEAKQEEKPPVVVAKLGPSPLDSQDAISKPAEDATLPEPPPSFGEDISGPEPLGLGPSEPLGGAPILVAQESSKKRTGLWIVLVLVIAVLVGVIIAIAVLMLSGCATSEASSVVSQLFDVDLRSMSQMLESPAGTADLPPPSC